jgi:hypothetical protein
LTYIEELDMLMKEGEGLLSPHRVVEYASNPETALHSRFDWDDETAGPKWRLHQARMMISVLVVDYAGYKTRAMVSVGIDRKRDDSGGYRTIQNVLGTADLRDMFLDQCVRSIEAMIARAGQFKEVAKYLEETVLPGVESFRKPKQHLYLHQVTEGVRPEVHP